MKNIFLGFTMCSLMLLTIAGILSLHTRSSAKTELEDALSAAVEQSLDNVANGKEYTLSSKEEFAADIMEAILLQTDSDAEITINVLEADLEKGILSVEAIEKFDYIGGKKGTVSAKKTAVLDNVTTSQEETYYTIQFFVKNEDGTEDTLYKSYTLAEGDTIPSPKDPDLIYASFAYWTDENGNKVTIDGLTADTDMNFYAKLN